MPLRFLNGSDFLLETQPLRAAIRQQFATRVRSDVHGRRQGFLYELFHDYHVGCYLLGTLRLPVEAGTY